MLIEGASLYARHREDQRCAHLLLLHGFDFGKIESCEAGVEMKLQLEAVAGLTISQSGKLLRVPKQKFNLKAQGVQLGDVDRVLLHIG